MTRVPGDRWPVAVALILLVSLALRLAFVAPRLDTPPRADGADFDRHARSIVAGHGYPESTLTPNGGPTAFRAPAYPLFLAASYEVAGGAGSKARFKVVRILELPVALLTVFLVGVVAAQLWDRRVALVSMALAAVYLPFIVFGVSLLSESLFLPLELAAVAAVLALRRSAHPYRWALAAGALAGVAALTRTNGVLLVPLLVAGALALDRAIQVRRWGPAAVLAVTAMLVILPWSIRNATQFHAFVPTTTQDGFTLAGTYNRTSYDDRKIPASWRPVVPQYRGLLRRRDLDEAKLNAKLRRESALFAAHHPLYVPKVLFWNGVRTLHLEGRSLEYPGAAENSISRRVTDLSVLAFWLLALLAVLGVATRPARQVPLFVVLVPVLMVLSVVVGYTNMRLRQPADPFLVMAAALALVAVWDRVVARRGGAPGD